MRELRWYLEHFLDYPFPPETTHAEHVLDALKAWGAQAFNVRSDDPHILSWPWEALFDPQANYLAHERRLNKLRDPQPLAALPTDRANILLVVARPYKGDLRYRSIARPCGSLAAADV